MIWQCTGNTWLDNWIRQAVHLQNELDSSACLHSPLDRKDREDIQKCLEKLCKINKRVSKRLTKMRKSKQYEINKTRL